MNVNVDIIKNSAKNGFGNEWTILYGKKKITSSSKSRIYITINVNFKYKKVKKGIKKSQVKDHEFK